MIYHLPWLPGCYTVKRGRFSFAVYSLYGFMNLARVRIQKKWRYLFTGIMVGPAHDRASVHGKLAKLLMAKILHQLRFVVYPIIYRVLCIPGGLPDFFHQQSYITFSSLRCKHATNPSMPHAGWLANVFCRHLVWNSFWWFPSPPISYQSPPVIPWVYFGVKNDPQKQQRLVSFGDFGGFLLHRYSQGIGKDWRFVRFFSDASLGIRGWLGLGCTITSETQGIQVALGFSEGEPGSLYLVVGSVVIQVPGIFAWWLLDCCWWWS